MRGQMHHLDLTVGDLERSRPFYELVLGFLGYRCVKDTDEVVVWDLILPDGVCGIALRPACTRAHMTATRSACITSPGMPTPGRMSTVCTTGWSPPASPSSTRRQNIRSTGPATTRCSSPTPTVSSSNTSTTPGRRSKRGSTRNEKAARKGGSKIPHKGAEVIPRYSG